MILVTVDNTAPPEVIEVVSSFVGGAIFPSVSKAITYLEGLGLEGGDIRHCEFVKIYNEEVT